MGFTAPSAVAGLPPLNLSNPSSAYVGGHDEFAFTTGIFSIGSGTKNSASTSSGIPFYVWVGAAALGVLLLVKK